MACVGCGAPVTFNNIIWNGRLALCKYCGGYIKSCPFRPSQRKKDRISKQRIAQVICVILIAFTIPIVLCESSFILHY